MTSLKAEKPVEKSGCPQPSAGQMKKESAAKPSSGTPKAPASKPAPKRTSSQSKKKVKHEMLQHTSISPQLGLFHSLKMVLLAIWLCNSHILKFGYKWMYVAVLKPEARRTLSLEEYSKMASLKAEKDSAAMSAFSNPLVPAEEIMQFIMKHDGPVCMGAHFR
ncbi:hypothetical protein E2542_SST23171 [Spatholobus suberectus]|nr:hypothetical protein E2542_SST23171 [Spatholobus suberectus]